MNKEGHVYSFNLNDNKVKSGVSWYGETIMLINGFFL